MAQTVRLFRWRGKSLRFGNFGDEITIPILERLLSCKVELVSMNRADLIAAGSILGIYGHRIARNPWLRLKHTLQRIRPPRGELHVWGTGANFADDQAIWPKKLKIAALRGKLTADAIGKSDVPLGDPGILASLLVKKAVAPASGIALVPHYKDFERLSRMELPGHFDLVNPDGPCLAVLERISRSELVVSSSLHGLITADSFAIPCVWAHSGSILSGTPGFKFRDYETTRGASFNTPEPMDDLVSAPLTSIADKCTVSNRDILKWQRDLLRSFPLS